MTADIPEPSCLSTMIWEFTSPQLSNVVWVTVWHATRTAVQTNIRNISNQIVLRTEEDDV